MLGVFWFIILAGLFGTKVSGRNAGPMIVWVLWLSAPDRGAGADRRKDLVHGLSSPPAGRMVAADPPFPKSRRIGGQIRATSSESRSFGPPG